MKGPFRPALSAVLVLVMAAAVFGAGLLVPAGAVIAAADTSPARAATTAQPETCSATPLDAATAFNVFVLGDLTQRNTDTEGRLAVGGQATLTNYSLGAGLSAGAAGQDTLVVGGALTFTQGVVVTGNAVSTGPGALANVTFAPGAGYRRGATLDFAAAGTTLRTLSTTYASRPANGTTRLEYGRVILTGTDPALNIFAVSGADLAAANSLTVNAPAGSTVLVNIGGAATGLRNAGFDLGGVGRDRVLYNFPEATALTLEGVGVLGSILAPRAAIAFNNGVIDGTLVGGSLTGSGQANLVPFRGCLPPTPDTPGAPRCAPGVDFLGFSDALDKRRFADTNVGGLSALTYDRQRDVYYSLVDNEGNTDARFYTLRLPLEGNRLGEPVLLAVTTLRDRSGQPFTGANFDGEGIVLTPQGDLLISSETEPSIRRFSLAGTLLEELPVPDRFRVAPAGEGRTNLTFESLALSPNGRSLFTANEGFLSPDGPTDDGRQRLRILRYAGGEPGGFTPAQQFYYLTEPTAGVGVVEIAALSERELLVLERGFAAGQGNTVRVFRVSLADAADVSREASLAGTALSPVSKELLVDLASCPPSGAQHPGAQANPLLDNFEGLAFGPRLADGRQTLLLQSDDNFGRTQVTRLIALAIPLQPERPAPARPILEGRAVLPADTFAPGPPAGAQLGTAPINGRTPPFPGQPVQGFSAVLDAGGGEYLAMPDNGFGAKNNSADFLLRVYRIRPDFKTAQGGVLSGSGTVAVGDFIQLRDPDRRVPFSIVNENTGERLLTGADFDIESLRQDARGDLWFGDEFGPFLLHTDATGRVLEAPIALPGVKSPQNPTLGAGESANLPSSRGFEGTAISPDRRTLYPSLEGALTDDPDQRRRFIYEFNLESRSYTGARFQYRTEAPANAIGDLTALDANRLLIIERDNEQGAAARFKKIYLIDLRRTDAAGFLVKREVLDLLAIRDPDLISLPGREGDIGLGDPFAFPFLTIESVLPLGGGRLLVANDNNYPFSAGRNPGRPDDNEFIIVRLEGLEDETGR